MNTHIAKSDTEADVNLVFSFPLRSTLLLTSRVFSAAELRWWLKQLELDSNHEADQRPLNINFSI